MQSFVPRSGAAAHRPPLRSESTVRSIRLSAQQLRLREHQLFLALTIIVGILAGLSAVLFTVAIDWVTRLFFGLNPSTGRLLLVPALVSLATGVLIAWVLRDVGGSGITQINAVFHVRRGVVPHRVAVLI